MASRRLALLRRRHFHWQWWAADSSSIALRFGHHPARDDPAEPDTHEDLVKAAVEILEEPALEAEIGLLAREQVLHDGGEAGTAAGELDHATRNASKQKPAVIDALGEPGAEFEVG